MNPTQALNDNEIDELDDFLMSEDTPESCMDISTLDGFLAAIVLNPSLIVPGEYLHWIWDMEGGLKGPAFASLDQANHIMQLLMRYYNSVQDAICNGGFAPLLYILEQDDDSEYFDAEGWCEGFLLGVTLFGEQWAETLENYPELFIPMVLLGTEDGLAELGKSADVSQAAQDACEAIASAVAILHEHLSSQREAEMQKRMARGAHSAMRVESVRMPVKTFKVGRDEECPCGSGKKFKTCCGVPPTLH